MDGILNVIRSGWDNGCAQRSISAAVICHLMGTISSILHINLDGIISPIRTDILKSDFLRRVGLLFHARLISRRSILFLGRRGGTWNGGGVFLDDTHVYINLMPDLWGTLDGKISPTGYHYVSQPKPEEYYGGEDLTPLLMRLRCHGWELDPDPNVGYLLTKKITNTLLLQKECLGREEEINKVCSLEGDTLLQVNGWCDYDTPRRRLVMADKCVLYAWALEDIERGRGYLASRKKLFSFQAVRPLFSPAPYASLWERPCPHVVPPSC